LEGLIEGGALGEVGLADWWRIMQREITVGLCLGTLLGVLGFCRLFFGDIISGDYDPIITPVISTVVGISLIGIVVSGTIAGSMLPLIMKRLGFDPAASSAPFVATFADVTGIVIYFSIATLLLKGILL